ncbi:MAG TPA: hypothetical protein VMT55_04690 [Candidatus Sulfotelmatobacter sp.]|nr:hypothetical protein [Candidatus Sulfotelmatobacter sp.]
MKHLNWLVIILLTVTVVNYPNPCNFKGGEVVTFEATSAASLETTFYVYDLSARLITHKAFSLPANVAGYLTWDGYSDANQRVGNGVYLYRLVDHATRNSVGKGKIWVINR